MLVLNKESSSVSCLKRRSEVETTVYEAVGFLNRHVLMEWNTYCGWCWNHREELGRSTVLTGKTMKVSNITQVIYGFDVSYVKKDVGR